MNFKAALLVKLAVLLIAIGLISCGGAKNKQTTSQGVGGYEVVRTPADDLDDLRSALDAIYVASAVGIGRSEFEMNARSSAATFARSELAASVSSIVKRIDETYMHDLPAESRQMFEQGTQSLVEEALRGATPRKYITTRNPETGRFTIYALVVLDPEIFKKAVETSLQQNVEFENRARHEAIMERFNEGIARHRSVLEAR